MRERVTLHYTFFYIFVSSISTLKLELKSLNSKLQKNS